MPMSMRVDKEDRAVDALMPYRGRKNVTANPFTVWVSSYVARIPTSVGNYRHKCYVVDLLRSSLCSSTKANNMRLRANSVILLLAPMGTPAFKQIGPWSDTLTSYAKVNGAAASGFLRPDDTRTDVLEAEMQPNATCTAEAPSRENEENLVHYNILELYMRSIIALFCFGLLWIMLGELYLGTSYVYYI